MNDALHRTNAKVIGLHRSAPSPAMAALAAEYNQRLSLIPMDLEHQESIDQATAQILKQVDHVDLLLNVAGILGDGIQTPGPERSIEKIQRDWLLKSMDVNCIGHVMLTKALVPLLKKKTDAATPSKIVNITARVGSIADNGLGGWYSYRMSKAAMNMFTKTTSVELKR